MFFSYMYIKSKLEETRGHTTIPEIFYYFCIVCSDCGHKVGIFINKPKCTLFSCDERWGFLEFSSKLFIGDSFVNSWRFKSFFQQHLFKNILGYLFLLLSRKYCYVTDICTFKDSLLIIVNPSSYNLSLQELETLMFSSFFF